MRAFILCLSGVLALTGCRSIWDPTFQPAGYSYHRNEYKSPPGPPAADIGYAYTADKNEQVQNEWRAALLDMLTKVEGAGTPIPQEVALATDLNKGATQGTMDSLIREGLRAKGYVLIDDKHAGPDTPKLFYSAYGEKTPRQLRQGKLPEYNDDAQHPEDSKFMPDKQNMQLVMGVLKNGQLISRTTGNYDLQVYGYEEGVAAYVPGFKRPVQLNQAPARTTADTLKVNQ